MSNLISFNEKAPKHLAIKMSKILEGKEYGVIAETLGILVGATCYSAAMIMGQEMAELFREDLLTTIEDHSETQETF